MAAHAHGGKRPERPNGLGEFTEGQAAHSALDARSEKEPIEIAEVLQVLRRIEILQFLEPRGHFVENRHDLQSGVQVGLRQQFLGYRKAKAGPIDSFRAKDADDSPSNAVGDMLLDRSA